MAASLPSSAMLIPETRLYRVAPPSRRNYDPRELPLLTCRLCQRDHGQLSFDDSKKSPPANVTLAKTTTQKFRQPATARL